MVEDELERDAKGLYSEIGSATSKGNQGEGAASSFNARPVVTGSNFSIFEKINGDLNSDDDEQDASASMEFIYRNLSVNVSKHRLRHRAKGDELQLIAISRFFSIEFFQNHVEFYGNTE